MSSLPCLVGSEEKLNILPQCCQQPGGYVALLEGEGMDVGVDSFVQRV